MGLQKNTPLGNKLNEIKFFFALSSFFKANSRTKDLALCHGGLYKHTVHGHKITSRIRKIIYGSHKYLACAGFEPAALGGKAIA